MDEFRWELADATRSQTSLFDEPVFEREPGRGEFRGMEFLHVRAHRIINEVRNAPFGFRYTINPYRGCSHACTYCCSGETPILMADGRTKLLADIRPGDEVYGTERRGDHRHYVPTTVLDHWSTVKPAYRVTLDDGTELITSGDHRFLTDRGWKHVVGAGHGPECRPHLTTESSLMGVGQFARPPEANDDYRRGYLCGIVRSDGLRRWHSYEPPEGSPGDVHRVRLALTDREALRRTAEYLHEHDVPTSERVVQAAASTRREVRAIATQARAGFSAVTDLVTWPTVATADWCKGFLAATFDAGGSRSAGGILRFSDTDDVTVRCIEACLRRFGFRYVVEHLDRSNHVRTVRLLGGLREQARFFHTVDPAVTRKRTFDGFAVESDAQLRVVSVEALGLDMPLYDITTATGDFIANGVVSHNCFARPSHTYLGLDAGDDFERRIVVKVNAVSLLRKELDPRRWPGELIAMGTNTDPYQRCEGKYRLTRGIVEVLSEQANPFSILTKSTLVLRDTALLAEAAKRTSARVSLSIGTLDQEVWRATEPGTPNPLRRVRAVEALNAAGVPCGVLVAPVLPGISDRPEQLEAVVRACVEAGAQSISTVLLHLRPGVKEVFLPRLAGTHPHLVDAYERRYSEGAYAPRHEQQAVDSLVRDLVKAHGGTVAGRTDPRHHTGAAPTDEETATTPVGLRAAGGATQSRRRRRPARGASDRHQPDAAEISQLKLL